MNKINNNAFTKIVSIILIALFLIYLFIANTYATINPDYFKPTSGGGSQKLNSKAGEVLGAVQLIGSIVSVITLAVIGIKYMVGSVEEKAEYKKTMLPYLIGAILVFATTNLVQIIYEIGKDINS